MNIVIDARWIFKNVSGIGAYTQELLHALPALDQENQYTVLFNNTDLANRTEQETGIGAAKNFHLLVISYGVFSVRNQLLLPSLLHGLQADVFHSPNYMVPLWPRRGRSGRPAYVTTVHDVIPLKFPDHAPKSKKTRLMPVFKRIMRRVAVVSDVVITVSRQSKSDIHEFMAISPSQHDKVHVVYNGVSPRFHDDGKDGSVSGTRDNSDERTLLYVGRADPYKNVPLLVHVLEALRERCPFPLRLVLAGPEDKRYPQAMQLAEQLGLGDRVAWTGYLSHDALADLYRRADALVHPSRYEGFGLQILEAMASGLPVVCSNGGSLPEVAGDAACVLEPDDLAGYVDSLAEILTNPIAAANLRERGFRQAAHFSWSRSAADTLAVYAQAVHKRQTT